MIVLFTDFGADDNYVGQVKAALLGHLPAGAVIIDLLHSVPNFHVRAGAHLLAALQSGFPADTVFFVRGRSGRRHRSRCRDPSSEQQMVCGAGQRPPVRGCGARHENANTANCLAPIKFVEFFPPTRPVRPGCRADCPRRPSDRRDRGDGRVAGPSRSGRPVRGNLHRSLRERSHRPARS